MELADLRDETRELFLELSTLRFDALSGLSAGFDPAPALRSHPAVWGGEAFAYLFELAGKSEGRRAARLRHLAARAFRTAALAASARPVSVRERLEREEDLAGLEPGERFSPRAARAAIAGVGGRDKRRALELALSALGSAHAGPLSEEIDAFESTASRAGFGSGADAVRALAGVDAATVAADAEAFLAGTQAMYDDVLAWRLKRTTGQRAFPHGAERHDVAHALSLDEFAGLFPRTDLVRTLTAPLVAANLTSERIQLDLEPRTHKHPSPIVAPVAREKVRVSVRRTAGAADAMALLEGLGRATSLALVDDDRPFEDFAFGDDAIEVAAGDLFSGWLLDRGWLARHLEAQHPDLVRVLALSAIARLRERAVRTVALVALHRDGASRAALEGLTDRFSHATGGHWPSGLVLAEAGGDLFSVLADLRGAALAATLEVFLRDRHDEDWWRNPRGIGVVRDVFRQGRIEPADALSERFGGGALTLSTAARRLEDLLGS